MCAIAKKKGQQQKKGKIPKDMRTLWAKFTKRKVMNKRTKKRVKRKVRSGEWCRLCLNMSRIKLRQPRYKKAETEKKGSGLKLLKSDLRKPGHVKEQWKGGFSEVVHLKCGGRSRINTYKTTVAKKSAVLHDTVAPNKEFWELLAYKDEFGDPKANKAKITEKWVVTENGTKKKRRGVIVTTGRKGVHKLEARARSSVEMDEQRYSGDEAVFEGGAEEAMEEAEDLTFKSLLNC